MQPIEVAARANGDADIGTLIAELPGESTCPRCGEPMAVTQPDEDEPLALLGVCPDCRAWSVLGPAARVLYLPGVAIGAALADPMPAA